MTTTATPPLTGTYVVDAAHSTISFAVRHMGVSLFRATFTEVEGSLEADGTSVQLTGSAPVESVSIQSPAEFREHVIYGDDFFDGKNHPQITAQSSEVSFHDDGTVTLQGELTIRGVTKPVTAEGTYRPALEDPFGGKRAALELTATVDRSDWGISWQAPLPNGGDALDNSVELSASIELVEES